ncbi:MAG: molecular chaperone DnaK [Candidatus Altiarchaeales archaeon WOR_SM1_86-2]|nr:MAG: molecular chaperone DnaK [Candidatus Altiarchaeales archaeon WOR_SM1_86-2]
MAEENKKGLKKERIIGIDLGTSNSAASVMMGGRPTIIPSAEGTTLYGKAFPSYVAFTKDGQRLVGEPARRQAVTNPEGTVFAAKRKIGTGHKYSIHGKEYTPQQISAFILQKIKEDAEEFLGERIKKAVITVPAYFNDNQRQATKDAGEIAGLQVVRLVNEPTAASMAYGIDRLEKEHEILVFDFGGGTLDVTIMEFGGGVFEVRGTDGDTQLGGTDMDNALIDYVAGEFKRKEGVDLRDDKKALIRLKEAVEKAKIELSTTMSTDINLPYIYEQKNLQMEITRAKLEQLVMPIIDKCKGPIDRAIKKAKMNREDITKIILVGGPTRMPVVQKFVGDYIGKKIERGVDPMECVASGAAIQGGILAGEVKDIVLLDVTPLTLAIETLGGVATPLIEANTTIPTKKSQIFSTAADMQTAVTINVVQGERPIAKDNTSLGTFNLVGIPPAPRGIPQIEVKFDIDANGILNVKAKDLGTGKEQGITITASTKLSNDEIEKMREEAEKFEDADKKKKEEVEVKNEADSMVYTAEKTLSELGDKIGADSKKKVEDASKELKDALSGDDIAKIKEKTDTLRNALQEVGQVIYQQAQAQQPPPEEEAKEEKGEKVVDAEYTEEKEGSK